MVDFPETGEFVLATVNKLMPYGAFCTLDEYTRVEAFLHVSEVSNGWVKNIRDHVKEGQKIVALIARIDLEKRQIDLSLKRVSAADRKKKLESYQMRKRAEKWLERAAFKLKKDYPSAFREVGAKMVEDAGELYAAFEMLKANTYPGKLPPVWEKALKEIAEAEIKQKEVKVRAALELQSYEGNGVEIIRDTLTKIEKVSKAVTVHYQGAPHYFVDVTVMQYKEADAILAKVQKALDAAKGVDYTFEKIKG